MMMEIKMNYETSGTENYLCAELSEAVSTYQMNMLRNNEIPGLLPVTGRLFNGRYILQYDITRLRRLKNVLEDGSLQGVEAKHLLYNILLRMTETGQYFLSYSQCMLNMEYMYVDDKNEIKFVYLPLGEQEITTPEDIRIFYQTLLTKYLTREKEEYADLLYYVVGQDFSVAGLLQMLGEDENQKQKQVREPNPYVERLLSEPVAPKPSIPKPQPVREQPPAPAPVQPQAASAGMGFAIPGGGNMAIPGGGNMAIPSGKEPSTKPQKEKKEKKDSVFGGIFKKSPEKGAAPVAPVQVPKQQEIKTPKPSVSSSSASSGAWKGTQIVGAPQDNSPRTMIMGVSKGPVLKHRGTEIEITHFPFTIGKQNADYTAQYPVISRLHATILAKDGKYFVRDENSSNHTYVNGTIIAPYTEVEIVSGTVLRLANEEMTFEE